MKIVLFIFIFQAFLFASLKDDYFKYKALSAYENKKYEKAYEYFFKIKNKDDKIFYNMANSLYKQKRYKKALELYMKIEDENLAHKKYHNMANIYISKNNYEKAIEFYEKALSYSNNEKTKFNLELSQNIQEKKRLEKIKKENITNKICRTGNKVIWSDIEPQEVELKEDKKLSFLLRFDNISKLQIDNDENIYISEGQRQDDNKTVLRAKEALKIDFYQKQKWDRKIENKKINTLLIPMEKGVISDNKKAW